MKKHISKLMFGLVLLPCIALVFTFSGGIFSAPATVHAAATPATSIVTSELNNINLDTYTAEITYVRGS